MVESMAVISVLSSERHHRSELEPSSTKLLINKVRVMSSADVSASHWDTEHVEVVNSSDRVLEVNPVRSSVRSEHVLAVFAGSWEGASQESHWSHLHVVPIFGGSHSHGVTIEVVSVILSEASRWVRGIQREGVSVKVDITWHEGQVVGRFFTLVIENSVPASTSRTEVHEICDFLKKGL